MSACSNSLQFQVSKDGSVLDSEDTSLYALPISTMSGPASNQTLHPVNPTLSKDTSTPKEKGQTRVLADGSLLYREPITGTEMPAVRLQDIRGRLVQEQSRKKCYRFPKARGYEPTNVTAFVKKDYNYGPKRAHRPDRLFQIHNTSPQGEKPDGYVMDEGLIVLDAFDHGLRNFGHQLPLYVSSELEGHDIEDYLRRNREISVYDLVARAPNGYYKGKPETKDKKKKKGTKKTVDNEEEETKVDEHPREWHEGPPRVGTFSMRATRFRLAAGCLSWETKDGTAAKNQRILDVIPDRFKDPMVNSTKEWRDLSTAEIKTIQSGAMRKPQQARKAKRGVQAHKREESAHESSVEEQGLLGAEEESGYQNQDAAIRDSTDRQIGEWLESIQEEHERTHVNLLGETGAQPSINDAEPSASRGDRSSNLGSLQTRKRFGAHFDADSDSGSHLRALKRAKVITNTEYVDLDYWSPQTLAPRKTRKPQRRPAQQPYASENPPPLLPRLATGSDARGQHSHPGPRNSRHQFSSQVPHEAQGQVSFDVHGMMDDRFMLPAMYGGNQQRVPRDVSSVRHQSAQNLNSYNSRAPRTEEWSSAGHLRPRYSQPGYLQPGYLQPGYSQPDISTSHPPTSNADYTSFRNANPPSHHTAHTHSQQLQPSSYEVSNKRKRTSQSTAPGQPSKRLKIRIADSAAAAMGVNPRFIEYFSTPSTEVDPIALEGPWQSDHTLAQAFTQSDDQPNHALNPRPSTFAAGQTRPSKRSKIRTAGPAPVAATGVPESMNPRFREYISTPSTGLHDLAFGEPWQSDDTEAQAFTRPEHPSVYGAGNAQPSKQPKARTTDPATAATGLPDIMNPRFMEYFSTPSTGHDTLARETPWQSNDAPAPSFAQPVHQPDQAFNPMPSAYEAQAAPWTDFFPLAAANQAEEGSGVYPSSSTYQQQPGSTNDPFFAPTIPSDLPPTPSLTAPAPAPITSMPQQQQYQQSQTDFDNNGGDFFNQPVDFFAPTASSDPVPSPIPTLTAPAPAPIICTPQQQQHLQTDFVDNSSGDFFNQLDDFLDAGGQWDDVVQLQGGYANDFSGLGWMM